jgi:type I restriction enzyme S subunit
LRITDIQEGKVNWDDVPYCEISEKERDSSLLSKGDIVFARTGATTGKSFLIHDCPENSVFASYLIRVRPIEELNPVFLFGYFQTAQYWKQISESATGSTQPGVNSTKLGELKVPVPPLSLQEEFAGVVARVESLRGRMGESTRGVEGLFESLLAESFS